MIRLAHILDILDKPNPHNPGKIHRQPIALLGGVAIYLTVLVISGFVLDWNLRILGLFSALTVIMLLGLIDDLRGLDYKVRLGVQFLVALFIVFGLDIKIAFLAEYPFIGYPLTLLWIVGVTNALNLMDNVDGATGGVSFIAALGLFGFAVLTGNTVVATLSVTLAGAVLAFLRFNFKPARIFLGDTGSLLLGLFLATLALIETQTLAPFSWHHAFIFPLLLGVPIYDTTLATLLRIYYGRPVYLADKSNLTYRLFDVGFSQLQTVFIEYGMGIYFLLCAMTLWWAPPAHGIFLVLITVGFLTFLGTRFAKHNSTVHVAPSIKPTSSQRIISYKFRENKHRPSIEESLLAQQTDH